MTARSCAAASVAAVTVLTAGCGSSPKASLSGKPCGHYRKDVMVEVGSRAIAAQKAATYEEQLRGLSGRPCIGTSQGMLFAFGSPVNASFDMKDMRFPIDIVWIDPNHRVVWIEHDISPSTYPRSFSDGGEAAIDVLELKAGRAKSLGLELGTHLSYD